ncbi:MAG: GDP-mannose 4,6-dehydratase [Candidatus Binatia bacterium]
MSIMVTGCAGFIGSKVCELLLADSHAVVGVDNLNDAYDVRLKKWRLDQFKYVPKFSLFERDICDRTGLRETFEQTAKIDKSNFDAVINLAARAGVRQSVKSPWVYVDTNITGTLNLLDLCREFGVKKFVLASTSSLYGANNPQPFHEDVNTDGPLSPYAASKKGAEALCYSYHYLYGLDVTVPRYFTVYGPAGRPDMSLFRFVQWISEGRTVTVYGNGQQSRDFTYIDDIARGTVAALRPVGYEVVNLGSDKPVILNDAIQLVERLVDRKAEIHQEPPQQADVMATWADISKAKSLLGWQPQTSFETGVENLVHWYRENREWASKVVTI